MNEHDRSLALAAAAMDFPLSTQEAVALERHLAGCAACALAVRRLQDDASSLAAMERTPAPPEVRGALVRAVAGGRPATQRTTGMRWSLAAALLALAAVGGTFVTGAVLDRLREPGPAPTDPTTVVRPTPAPQATAAPIPAPTPGGGWQDLGLVGSAFDGRTVQLVLPAPDGGLVAIGRDQVSTLPVVWTSDDGSSWVETDQPDDVFGGRVPTGGTLHDGALWVVGWQIAAQGPQRAIWSSTDGVTWRLAGSGGLLGTEASDLDIVSGPAGLLVWAPDGRVWTSTDQRAWARSDVGAAGITDAAVDERAFYVVGRDDGRPFVVVSVTPTTWSDPSAAAQLGPAGIERDGAGVLLPWVGDTPFAVTRSRGWAPLDAASPVPSVSDPQHIVGGTTGFAAIDAPGSAGVQRGWVGDGRGAWTETTSEPTAKGARTLVAVAPLGDGWYVLTRQGSAYRGWRLS